MRKVGPARKVIRKCRRLMDDRGGKGHGDSSGNGGPVSRPKDHQLDPRSTPSLPRRLEGIVGIHPDRATTSVTLDRSSRQHGRLRRVADLRNHWGFRQLANPGQGIAADLQAHNPPVRRQPSGELQRCARQRHGWRRLPVFHDVDGELVVHDHPAFVDSDPHPEVGDPGIQEGTPVAVFRGLFGQHAVRERDQYVAEPVSCQRTGGFEVGGVLGVEPAAPGESPAYERGYAVTSDMADEPVIQQVAGGGVAHLFQFPAVAHGAQTEFHPSLIDLVQHAPARCPHIFAGRLGALELGAGEVRHQHHGHREQAGPT